MALFHQGFFFFRRQVWPQALAMKMMSDSFLAAGNLKQLMVLIDIPLEILSKFFERVIEGDPVAISFGIDDDAVLVKKDCFYLWHISVS